MVAFSDRSEIGIVSLYLKMTPTIIDPRCINFSTATPIYIYAYTDFEALFLLWVLQRYA